MLPVSPQWKETINMPGIRPKMEFIVNFHLEDTDFRDIVTITDNGHVFFSYAQGLSTIQYPPFIYGTAETGLNLLDGTLRIPDVSDNEFQGFISENMSNEHGYFTGIQPKLIIRDENNDRDYEALGLWIEFDSFNNDYATEFTIEWFNHYGEMTRSIDVKANNTPRFQYDDIIPAFNRIEITFKRTFNPHRRIRVIDLIFGLSQNFYSYGDNSIISMRQKTAIKPIMNELPQTEFDFTIRDEKGVYDPENPRGIWKYIQRGQVGTPFYIFNNEKVSAGIFYLTEKPTTSSRDVTFKFTGIVQFLTQEYTRGRYYPDGRTFYDLFEDLLSFSVYPIFRENRKLWRIDEKLKNYKCYLPLPVMPVNQLLQILCQATAHILFEDTDGYVYVRENEEEHLDYIFDLSTLTDYPSYEKMLPNLSDIVISRYTANVTTEISELHKSTVSVYGEDTIYFKYDFSIEQSATVTNGQLISSDFYAYGCFLTIKAESDNIHVLINGKKVEIVGIQYTYPVADEGETAFVHIPLVTDDITSDLVAAFYEIYLKEIRYYKINHRGTPEIRANDIPLLNTRFVRNMVTRVLSNEYSWSGGSNGVTEFKTIRMPVYTVVFDSMGGIPETIEIQVIYGNKVARPLNPVKDEHYFLGWFTDQTFTTAWRFDVDIVLNNMMLYAKWLPISAFAFKYVGEVYSGEYF